METLIDFNWRPHPKTSSSLEKLGYTEDQRKTIGKIFLQRFGGQTIDKASSKFYNMVRSSGAAHKPPKPDMTASNDADKKRADDIANRPKDAHEKAEAAHSVNNETSQDYAKNWIDKQREFK